MADGTQTMRPHYLLHIPLETWKDLPEEEKKRLIAARGKAKIEVKTVSGKVEVPAADSKLKPLRDVREWNEEVDGVSAERLRNCIIFQLDVKKSNWYRMNITPSFIRRNAKKLDDETPIGWTTNPLIRSVKVSSDREELQEKRIIARNPRDSEEWEYLHSLIVDSRGKANNEIVMRLVKSKCPKCRGTGGYNMKVNPNARSIKKRYEEFYHSPCECCHKNPFDGSYILRCRCGRDIIVPKTAASPRVRCKECGVFHPNPRLAEY